jgi:hypothetical protein
VGLGRALEDEELARGLEILEQKPRRQPGWVSGVVSVMAAIEMHQE